MPGRTCDAKRLDERCEPLRLFDRAATYGDRLAVVARDGTLTYAELLDRSARIASCLLNGRGDLKEKRIAFLAPSGVGYVVAQWGIWRAGGIAVPLCALHPRPELETVIEDSTPSALLADPEFVPMLAPIASARGLPLITTAEALATAHAPLPQIDPSRRAMILYTSGTTSRPKGVVTTHRNIEAQVTSLIEAWEWTPHDRILHVLPLHHIHGIVNALTCALWAGATCEMMPRFDAERVWRRIREGGLTLFMAVPTIYSKLIAAWESRAASERIALTAGCASFRLMVSGSAALPVPVLDRWREISGHVLLERYGMTEIGMALSNPLHGARVPGSVGMPLPRIDVRLVDEAGAAVQDGEPGEIEARGPGVFSEYWNRPDATRDAFRDGWFRTGDVAIREEGRYRILGRQSVDIIKTGGYKVSALEIESTLRSHPDIRECAVVGVPDPEWGERVCAALVLRDGRCLALDTLRAWAKARLAPYKVPTRLRTVDALPRNAMGKVTKPRVRELFDSP